MLDTEQNVDHYTTNSSRPSQQGWHYKLKFRVRDFNTLPKFYGGHFTSKTWRRLISLWEHQSQRMFSVLYQSETWVWWWYLICWGCFILWYFKLWLPLDVSLGLVTLPWLLIGQSSGFQLLIGPSIARVTSPERGRCGVRSLSGFIQPLSKQFCFLSFKLIPATRSWCRVHHS